MSLHSQAMRGMLFLLSATLFFYAMYTITGIPSEANRIEYNLVEPSTSLDLSDIVTDLFEQKLSCHRYYRRYFDTSEAPPSGQLMLYQPPCPLGRNLPDFRFLINQDVCSGNEEEDIYMLVLVGSHPSHRSLRAVIRRTWGNPNITGFPFRLAFFFGQMPTDEQQIDLDAESREHRDIIQGSFEDSYRNVLLRDLMGLRWAWQYCYRARFIMHADDDIAVDVYGLIDSLQQRFDGPNATGGNDFVGCFQMLVDTPVLRTGRYMVNETEHPAEKYDPYCQGWMYILTPAMAYKLDVAALRVPSYWMNDAYITGTLIKELGKVPLNLNVDYTIIHSQMRELSQGSWSVRPKYTVGPTGGDTLLTQVLHDYFTHYARLHGLPKSSWPKRAVGRLKPTSTSSTFNDTGA